MNQFDTHTHTNKQTGIMTENQTRDAKMNRIKIAVVNSTDINKMKHKSKK